MATKTISPTLLNPFRILWNGFKRLLSEFINQQPTPEQAEAKLLLGKLKDFRDMLEVDRICRTLERGIRSKSNVIDLTVAIAAANHQWATVRPRP